MHESIIRLSFDATSYFPYKGDHLVITGNYIFDNQRLDEEPNPMVVGIDGTDIIIKSDKTVYSYRVEKGSYAFYRWLMMDGLTEYGA